MSEERRCLAVLGAGTMGHGIAQIAAAAGYLATLYDVDMSAVEKGVIRIRENLEKAVSLGKATEQECHDTLSRIQLSSELEKAVHEADVVFEAIPEIMDLKQGLLKQMEQALSPDTLIASNTSSLSITELVPGFVRAAVGQDDHRFGVAMAPPGRLLESPHGPANAQCQARFAPHF